ncbi:MAG TPA: zinc-binding alcohol dehydrogenase family protein [Solirubrobacteraceae bacterium]|jgi:NADPH2:quinone reductase|nr:zinc-binding alcohol dehydrogenase family protein [Solirubrobacteraceae bacterium]
MRAAILQAPATDPQVGAFDDPIPTTGQLAVAVAAAGVNPIDIRLASGQLGQPRTPAVVGLEGVGTLDDGQRIYFSPCVWPYGSWAQRTLVEPERAFPVPDGLSDELAVAIGISGIAAWIPLAYHADVQPGESVLVLGATGTVGRIAVQAAKLLGAGRVVGAARDADALREVEQLGADATVPLCDDYAAALRDAAGAGFDVVIDPLYGEPFEAALPAAAIGARLVTIGESAGPLARIPFRALQGRTHVGHGSAMMPNELLRDAYAKLAEHAVAGRIAVEVERYPLERAGEAWRAQQAGLRRKLVIVP